MHLYFDSLSCSRKGTVAWIGGVQQHFDIRHGAEQPRWYASLRQHIGREAQLVIDSCDQLPATTTVNDGMRLFQVDPSALNQQAAPEEAIRRDSVAAVG